MEPAQDSPVSDEEKDLVEVNDDKKDLTVDEGIESETRTTDPEVIKPEHSTKKKRLPGWLHFDWLKSAKVMLVLVLIVNLGIGGTTLYLYKYKRHNKTVSKVATVTKVDKVAINSDQTTKKVVKSVDTTLLHFSSDSLKTEFDYPVDWRLDSSPEDTSISLTTSQTEVTDGKGKKQSGTITIEIETKEDAASTQFGQVANDANIKANSEIMKYNNPTDKQRKQTTLTFVDMYGGGAVGSDFEAIVVTGNISFKTGQKLNSKDLSKINPRITIRGYSCPEEKCQYDPVMEISTDSWQNNEVFKKVRDVLASMRFK